MQTSKLAPEIQEQIAIELMDLLDDATVGEGYHLAKSRFRLLLAERFSFDKLRCTLCRLWKERAAYGRHATKARGLDYVCRDCRSRCQGSRLGRR